VTPLGDDRSEMHPHRRIDDDTAERLLAGLPVDGDCRAVVAVVRACRRLGERPVAPRGELVTWLAAGVPPRCTAGGAGGAADRTDRRGLATVVTTTQQRPRVALGRVLATVAAKVAGLSVAVKVALGATIAAASISTAGMAGVLPDAWQVRFDAVVETVIPTSAGPDDEPGSGQVGGSDDDTDADGTGEILDADQVGERERQRAESPHPQDHPAPTPPAHLPTPPVDESIPPEGSDTPPANPPQPTPPASRP
jgi:hypothetical protein